jgi:hypothetical protein
MPNRDQTEVAVKYLLVVVSLCLLIAGLAGGQTVYPLNAIQHPFAEGGFVSLKLSSGDYTIRAGSPDRIWVQWAPAKAADLHKMKKIRFDFETSGNATTVRTDGPLDDARVVIELPERTDLKLKIFAGDVRIHGIHGDKDINMTFGDLSIDMKPVAYFDVHASVKLGDLNARSLGVSKEGIGRSFSWQGGGKYRLKASLFAGDLILN